MRTIPLSCLLPLLVVGSLAVTACGDGVDSRTEPGEPVPATTTTEPEPAELSTFEVDQPDLVVDDTTADYSGAGSALQLVDGTWLVSG